GSVGWFFTPDFGKIFGYYLLSWLVQIAIGGIAGLIGVGLATLMPPLAPFVGLLGTIFALIEIIFAFVLLWLLFKVWWMMVKTYLTLMFLIVIGPWQIMLGLLPGQQGFGGWFRNIIANASVFLTVPIMFLLNMFFWPMSPFSPLGQVNGGASDLPSFPLFATKGGIFGFAVGFAILSMIPKIADIIRDALKIPPFKYGSALGEALSPLKMVTSPAGGAISAGGSNELKGATTGLQYASGGIRQAAGDWLKGSIR
ncbi:MAG: hypothetical protein AAB909_02275, partial [Patescibacteria group bacterium]